MHSYSSLIREFRALATPEKAERARSFFKTAPGEYSAHDQFLGIRIPEIRAFSKKHDAQLNHDILLQLLHSKWHEERLLTLLTWVSRYARGGSPVQESIFELYLKHKDSVNNWDLVDLSAPPIVGAHLLSRDRARLYSLSQSDNLWHRRIAMVSTLTFIRANQLDDTLALAEILRHDSHDLMHKAVGWMLRELGKKDVSRLKAFLDTHKATLPRTLLRYAIEKFPPEVRKAYLSRP